MAQAHDGAGSVFFRRPGADFQFRRQIFLFDDQRMVAGGRHRHGQALEDAFVVVHDGAGFAMHEMGSAHDFAAESFADGLMSQADAQHGNFSGELANQFDADAGILRSAGAGRDDDPLRLHCLDFEP